MTPTQALQYQKHPSSPCPTGSPLVYSASEPPSALLRSLPRRRARVVPLSDQNYHRPQQRGHLAVFYAPIAPEGFAPHSAPAVCMVVQAVTESGNLAKHRSRARQHRARSVQKTTKNPPRVWVLVKSGRR